MKSTGLLSHNAYSSFILLLDQHIVAEENNNTPRIHNNNVPCCLYKQTLMAFILVLHIITLTFPAGVQVPKP